MALLTDSELLKLKQYKYISCQGTTLDNLLNHLQLKCLEFIPLWVAPNLLTILGFISTAVPFIIMMMCDQTMQADLPELTFLLSAICIILYQFLDALDGKQARRTGTSSPLGNLFDHGCDCFSTTFVLICLGYALQADRLYFFLLYCVTQGNLFTANWIYQLTSILPTQALNIGVTEAQYMIASVQLVTYIKGQQFWHIPFWDVFYGPDNYNLYFYPLYHIQTRSIGTLVIFLFIGIQAIVLIYNIMSTLIKVKCSVYKALIPFIPLVYLLYIGYSNLQNNDLYLDNSALILFNIGFIISFITIKLILCAMVKS